MDDRRSGFATGDFEHERVAYEDGAMVLRLKSPGRSTWTTRPLGDWPLVEVEATMTPLPEGTGLFGLICGPSNEVFYTALVDTAGGVAILRVSAGQATVLATDPAAAAVPIPGQPLAMRLACSGTEAGALPSVSLSIDGSLALEASDPTGFASFQRSGFYGESGPTSEGFSVSGDDMVVRAGLRAEPPPVSSASPSMSLTGDPAGDALAAHVPPELRQSCRVVSLADRQPAVAIDCPSGSAVQAAYLQYEDDASLTEAYDALVEDHPEATGVSCDVSPSEGPYTVDGVEVGRLLCFEEDGSARLVWTDERLDIMGDAVWSDATYDALYRWWLAAGPIP